MCGSGRLTWGSVGDEVGRLVDAGQDPHDWLSELALSLGVDVGPGLLSLAAWRCEACGELGVFGPVEVVRDGSGQAASGGSPQAERATCPTLLSRTVSGLPGSGLGRAVVRRGVPDLSP